MIYRHSDEEIQEYFDRIGINQSALKSFLSDGVEKFLLQLNELMRQKDLYYEEKKHFIIGSAVDAWLTQGEEAFKNKYHYSQLKKKPSDTGKSIIKMVFDRVSQETVPSELLPFISYKEVIYHACNEHEYLMNRKAPTDKQMKEIEGALTITNWWNYDNRWSTIKNAQEYWADLILANGKQVLTDDEYKTINDIIISITTHVHTRDLFKDSENMDIVFQFPMYWEYEGTDCKGLIDHTLIDHSRRKIMPIDEKTLGDYVLNFPKAAWKRRYDIQGSFYTEGLSKNLDRLSAILGKDVTGYTISNYAFLTESTIKPGTPMIYVLNDDLMKVGAEGDGENLKGWKQAMNEYLAWKAVDFSVREKFRDTNGVIWLDGEFKMLND